MIEEGEGEGEEGEDRPKQKKARACATTELFILANGDITLGQKKIWVKKLTEMKVENLHLCEKEDFFRTPSTSSSKKLMVAIPDLTVLNVHHWVKLGPIEKVKSALKDVEIVNCDWIFEIFKTKSLPAKDHPYRVTSIQEELSKKMDDNDTDESSVKNTRPSYLPHTENIRIMCECDDCCTCPQEREKKCEGKGAFQLANEVATQPTNYHVTYSSSSSSTTSSSSSSSSSSSRTSAVQTGYASIMPRGMYLLLL